MCLLFLLNCEQLKVRDHISFISRSLYIHLMIALPPPLPFITLLLYTYFIGEELEAQRTWVTRLKSCSLSETEPRLNLGLGGSWAPLWNSFYICPPNTSYLSRLGLMLILKLLKSLHTTQDCSIADWLHNLRGPLLRIHPEPRTEQHPGLLWDAYLTQKGPTLWGHGDPVCPL